MPKRQLVRRMLGGIAGRAYIGFMPSQLLPLACLPVVAGTLLWPAGASAQAFSADYRLSPASSYAAGGFTLGGVRLGPVLQADAQFAGAGLSLAAGTHWFAQVSAGRSLQYDPGHSGGMPADALRIAGGYRWASGRSLSLQVTSGTRSRIGERLGLAVSYDWPRYYLRLAYDSGLNPVPQDNLRFSAGVRF